MTRVCCLMHGDKGVEDRSSLPMIDIAVRG